MNILPHDALLQGAEKALQAYTRAADAYTEPMAFAPIALWTVLITAGLVLVEWLLGRLRA